MQDSVEAPLAVIVVPARYRYMLPFWTIISARMLFDGNLHLAVAVRGTLPTGVALAAAVEKELRDGGSVVIGVWKQSLAADTFEKPRATLYVNAWKGNSALSMMRRLRSGELNVAKCLWVRNTRGEDAMLRDLGSLRAVSEELGVECPMDVLFLEDLDPKIAPEVIARQFSRCCCNRGGDLWVQGKLQGGSQKVLANAIKGHLAASYFVDVVG